MAFSDNLKLMREKRGLSQLELAQAVGVSQAAISDFERGKKLPAIDVAVAMEDILHTTCKELVDGKEQTA